MRRPEELTAFAREMRRAPTPGEDWLWGKVRSRRLGGFKFRRQEPMGPFIVDFVCEEAKLIVELDGMIHDQQVAYDLRRKAYLESLGYRVFRIGTEVKVTDGCEIPYLILEACREQMATLPLAEPSPQPSPSGRGGPEAVYL